MSENTIPAARVILSTNLVAKSRTDAGVRDVVRSLNAKLAKLTSWRGISTTLYDLTATIEDGAIVVRATEPDRTMTGQPGKVWAEEVMDVNMSAVWLYRYAKSVNSRALSTHIRAYLKENPLP